MTLVTNTDNLRAISLFLGLSLVTEKRSLKGMEEACKDCSKWEEDMYWTHFQTMHFCQYLHGNFRNALGIPKKFAKKLKEKLPESVMLKGPSGVTWTVGLVKRDDTVFFEHGWEEFVKDHSLEENDMLFFKYQGNSRFDVLIIDQGSLCEKESSYFVRKCAHEKVRKCAHEKVQGETVSQTKRKTMEVEDIETSSDDDAVCNSLKKTKENSDVIPLTSERPLTSRRRTTTRANGKAQSDVVSDTPVPLGSDTPVPVGSDTPVPLDSDTPVLPKSKRGRKPSAKIVLANVNSDGEPNSPTSGTGYQLQYVSNRRIVTEEDKEKALQMAQAAATDESIIIVMRPSHVYKRFFISLPSDWARKHSLTQNFEVILRLNNEATWRVRYYYNTHRNNGAFSSGWKDFAVDNNLEEFDVCLFEMSSQIDTVQVDSVLLMDVKIFRVVEEITPLTRVTSPPPSKGRSRRAIKNSTRKTR